MAGPYWDEQWNPVVGCSAVSPGCEHCWAAAMESRFHPALAADGRWLVGPQLHPERLERPFRWKKPRRIFVCNMGDLFHDAVPDEYIAAVFGVMAATPQHTYLVLTKRAERIRAVLAEDDFAADVAGEWDGLLERGEQGVMRGVEMRRYSERDETDGMHREYMHEWSPEPDWPLANVWLGVSVEDQRRADERIPVLLDTPAAHRWVSLEPMLEAVDMRPSWRTGYDYRGGYKVTAPSINWCVVGSESGPHRRPMSLDWARSVRDQCQSAGVPFLFKQAEQDGRVVEFPELDGRTWKEVPRG